MAARRPPATNVEVVCQGYERFNEGDLEWVMEHVDEAVSWVDAPEIPDARTYHGRPAVRAYLESILHNWEWIRFEPRAVRELGDVIVVECRLSGRGRTSGVDVDAELVHVWRLEDLRVHSIETYFDRAAALAAAEHHP
jgi:ketosteroid isomerase-like protein